MKMKEKIEKLVIEVVAEIAEDQDNEALKAPTSESKLFGARDGLDSMGIVMMVSDLEERIEEDLDVEVTLADERAMSLRNSPFRTVGSLVDYILPMVTE